MSQNNASEETTKVSVSILGDAFADIFCNLENGLPPREGDVRVATPMIPVAGGSGLNTATHLSALIRYFDTESIGNIDVTLQTCINESDHYGQIILNHAKKHDFPLLNCNKKIKEEDEKDQLTTWHCIVFVEKGQRRFATHIGTMSTFKASDTMLHELVGYRTADPKFINHHHHIHIAGFYNIPGFAKNGNLKKRLNLIREKRRAMSTENAILTTTISLVPQYDATEEWDGGLLTEVLPLVDFFILNSLEAGKLSNIDIEEEKMERDLDRKALLVELADFFWEKSPQTYVIVTLGKFGAVCLFMGEIIATVNAPDKVEQPLDSTGAGDSFAAGFIFGAMDWRRSQGHENCSEIGSSLQGAWTGAIVEGMWCGTAVGTSCVKILGASVPPSKEKLEMLLYPEETETDYDALSEEDRDDDDDSDSYYSDEDSDYTSGSYSESDESYSTEDDGDCEQA